MTSFSLFVSTKSSIHATAVLLCLESSFFIVNLYRPILILWTKPENTHPYKQLKTVAYWHCVPGYPSLNSASLVHKWVLVWRNFISGSWCFPNNLQKTGHFSGSETIFTNWKQSVANVTWNWRNFLMHSIAQSSASISARRGERLALTFFAPINTSKPDRILNQPCPENISFSFQKSSVKHHFLGINCRVAVSICGIAFCMFNICASTRNADYVFAQTLILFLIENNLYIQV